MQIVIDIDDNEYLGIKELSDNTTSYPVTIHLYEAVRNGTPLPKGHVRLKDVDAFIASIDGGDEWDDYASYLVDNAPTIIEADKVESESEECNGR